MNRYDEVLIQAYELDLSSDKQYVCKYCKVHLKTLAGIWRHLENKHQQEIYQEACLS
jgi:hypothetical protein